MSDDYEWVRSVSVLPTTVDACRNMLKYSRESAERLLGLYGQDQEIADWAEAHDYTIVGGAKDNEVHGLRPAIERPGLSWAIQTIEDGDADGIIVADLSRLARDFQTQDDAMQRIWRAGGTVVSCDPPQEWKQDKPGDMQWTTRRAYALRYEEDLHALLARLQKGRERLKRHGGYIGGPRFGRKYGSELVEVQGVLRYRPIPEEQEVIKRIKTWREQGVGLGTIAKRLNAEEIPTVKGAKWSKKTVRDQANRDPVELGLAEREVEEVPFVWLKKAAGDEG